MPRDAVITRKAEDDLRELGFLRRHAVGYKLKRFWEGAVSPDQLEELLVAPRDPPWRILRLEVEEVVVLLRRLSDEELVSRGLNEPTLLVARVVPRERLQEALADLPDEDQGSV